MAEIVDLGTSRLHPVSNAIEAQCQGPALSEGRAPDYGQAPLMQALGVSARPAPANANGAAQAVRVEVPGTNGVLVGCTDVRSAINYFDLGPGETCLHATGEGFDSRVLCKKQILSIVVGDDMVFNLDREEGVISISFDGNAFQIDRDGISMTTGKGAMIQLTGDTIRFEGKEVHGKRQGVPHYVPLSATPVISPTTTVLTPALGATWIV